MSPPISPSTANSSHIIYSLLFAAGNARKRRSPGTARSSWRKGVAEFLTLFSSALLLKHIRGNWYYV